MHNLMSLEAKVIIPVCIKTLSPLNVSFNVILQYALEKFPKYIPSSLNIHP